MPRRRPNPISTAVLFVATACLATLAGCNDQHARVLVESDPAVGKFGLNMLGSPEKLQAAGRIDGHRRIRMPDGVEIDTWVIAGRGGSTRGTALLLHGLKHGKSQTFGLGEELADRGFDVVLMDHRAHGRSDGKCITWGAKEADDARRVIDALLAVNVVRKPIYVWGVSMGGAAAIRYAASDSRIAGCMAVAPYTSGPEVARPLLLLLSPEKYEQAWQQAGKLADFDPRDTNVLAAARRLHCPLVVVHGTLDTLVPFSHGEAIVAAAAGPAELIAVPTDHATVLVLRDAWFADRMVDLAEGRLPARNIEH
jgi:pimeloyl-ACP methyl ester carboxylesterase